MKVLILVGSGDLKSRSLSLGNAIQKELSKQGAVAEIINLIETGIPLYDRSIERADKYNKATKDFLNKSYEADAFVWVTPIYHNSYSSILKNALDWQHSKFPGKIVGLASNGGNRSPQAVDQLMTVARAQHLLATRVRVNTDAEDYNDKFELTDKSIINRVKDFSEELIDLTKRNQD